MKIEHFAINVEEPLKMADWYVKNMGMEIIKQDKKLPYTTFLADDSGRVMIEVYKNPADQIPDYYNMDPLIMHIAWVSEDPAMDKNRLIDARATVVSDDLLDNGSHLVMLRDPWGIPLQFCRRANPMLKKIKR